MKRSRQGGACDADVRLVPRPAGPDGRRSAFRSGGAAPGAARSATAAAAPASTSTAISAAPATVSARLSAAAAGLSAAALLSALSRLPRLSAALRQAGAEPHRAALLDLRRAPRQDLPLGHRLR